MQRIIRAILFIAALICSPLSLAAVGIPAGVDLIFLIDQSGSMTGSGATTVANDKYGTRIKAIKQLEGMLEQSALAGYINRISVIEFGGRNANSPAFRPQVTLQRLLLPSLKGDARAKSQFNAGFDRIEQRVKPAYRGDTDIARALELADSEVKWYRANAPALRAGARVGERKRVVVLITDGAPYADGVSGSQMFREVDQWSETFKQSADSVTFVVFGLQGQGDTKYWDKHWGGYWKKYASVDPQSGQGLAFKVDTSNPLDVKVAEKVWEVVNELIPPGVSGPVSYDTYTAPAYLKALNFTIDYASSPWLPEGEIQVLAPDGSRLPLREYRETAATIVLQDPPPGKYQLRQTNARYKVNVLPIYEAARLTAPKRVLAQYAKALLRYRLDGRGPGGVFEPQGNLPAVNFVVEVQAPDGTVQTFRPRPSKKNPGEIVSAGEFEFKLAGKYRLGISGKTRARDGAEHVIYRAEDWVDVTTATPVEVRFEAPGADDELGLRFGAGDLPVEVRFYKAKTGAEIPPSQVLAPGGELRIDYFEQGTMHQPGGAGEGVPLRVNGNALRADLEIDFGEWRWDWLWRPGAIRLLLKPAAAVWQDDIQYIGIAGTGDHSLGPSVPVTESRLFLSIFIVLSLLVLLALGWLVWHWFMLSWLIRRSDENNSRAPRLLFAFGDFQNSGNNREWPLEGKRVITEPNLITLKDGNTWMIEKFRIKRLRRPGKKVAVEVAYRPYGEKKGLCKRRLEAADDSRPMRACRAVEGLPDGQAAEFVLLAGERDKETLI